MFKNVLESRDVTINVNVIHDIAMHEMAEKDQKGSKLCQSKKIYIFLDEAISFFENSSKAVHACQPQCYFRTYIKQYVCLLVCVFASITTFFNLKLLEMSLKANSFQPINPLPNLLIKAKN